jgi:hypothetical protein
MQGIQALERVDFAPAASLEERLVSLGKGRQFRFVQVFPPTGVLGAILSCRHTGQ